MLFCVFMCAPAFICRLYVLFAKSKRLFLIRKEEGIPDIWKQLILEIAGNTSFGNSVDSPKIGSFFECFGAYSYIDGSFSDVPHCNIKRAFLNVFAEQ